MKTQITKHGCEQGVFDFDAKLLESLKPGDLLTCYYPPSYFEGMFRVKNKTTLELVFPGFAAYLDEPVRRISVRGHPCKVSTPEAFNCYHYQMGRPYIYERYEPGRPVAGKLIEEIYEQEMREAGLIPAPGAE